VAAGTVLKLEKPATPVTIERNGERYLIKGGDTLGTISNEVYGTTAKWRKLWDNNRQLIHNPNRIYAGFYLYYVPEAGAPAPLASGTGSPSVTDQARTPASAQPSTPTQAQAPSMPDAAPEAAPKH
jgi:hypothetical protein